MINGFTKWLATGAGATVLVAATIGVEGYAAPSAWAQAPHTMRVEAPPDLPDVKSVLRKDPLQQPATPAPRVAARMHPRYDTPGTMAMMPAAPQIVPAAGPPVPAFPAGLQVPNPGPNGLPMGTITSQGGGFGEVYVITTVIGDGRPPMALLHNGNDTEIVGLGDRIGGKGVKRIVNQGVEFDDGTRLAVSQGPASGASQSGANPTNGSSSFPASEGPVSRPSSGSQRPNGSALNAGSGTNGAAAAPGQGAQPTVQSNGTPVVSGSPYPFGALPTPAAGTTPAPVPHYFGPAPGQNPGVPGATNP